MKYMTPYEYWCGQIEKQFYDDCIARGSDPNKVTWDIDFCGAVASRINDEARRKRRIWFASAVLLVVTIALVAFIFIA